MALPTVEQLVSQDLFSLLGIEEASEEKKKAILEQLTTLVDARVINRVSAVLSEEDAKKFAEIAENSQPEELVEFLVKKDIDLPSIVSEEATRARVEFIELVKLAQEK